MRIDGRKTDQIRPVKIERSYLKYPEGSALITVGETKIICTASVEERVPLFLRGEGKGWVTAEYAMLPRATPTRTAREVNRGRIEGRNQEIQRLIGRVLRAVVNLEALGERTIWIDCDVIQADGGTRTAAITGSFVALAQACSLLVQNGTLKSFPLKKFLAATSVGKVNGEILLDLSFAEDAQAEVDMNVAMTEEGEFVEIQATAENSPFTFPELKTMLTLAAKGIRELITLQQEVLGELSAKIRQG